MNGFISCVVDRISDEDLHRLTNYAFVFPTKRAGYYFRDAILKKHAQKTFWLPRILSIEDFIVHCTGRVISNEIDLLFALYQVYSNTYLTPPEGGTDKEELPTFDKFYAWGQVLLSDFDEVDRHMVNAKELYRNLEQLRELENRYQDDEEILFALKRFNQMVGNEPTVLSANFINQWSRVSKTYYAFKASLKEHNLSYAGMLYRMFAEQLEQKSMNLPFNKVVFAGFNALSKSEEIIINSLLKGGMATVFWDADKLYLDNEQEEAGKFMRRNYKKWPPSDQVHWIITDMVNEPKKIQVIGGVQAVGQAQVVGQLLSPLSREEQNNFGIVLTDEGLMFPLLYALPENIETLNVTMGYPTRQSQWFRLANAYMEYQLHISGSGNKAYAEIEQVTDLLTNPLIQRAVPSVKRWTALLKQKGRWLPVSKLTAEEAAEIQKLAFKPKDRVEDLMGSLVDLLMTIYQKLRLSKDLGLLETEFAYHSLKYLMQLQQQIQKYHQQLEPKTLARLIVQAFEQSRIPFSEAPSNGLQLMGFLETRALDFDRIIMVSVNEGKLPRGVRFQSYIPYAIRKAFKLPTFEEQDAIYAYHFKRVLQRAKDITILYNTEVAIDGSGEKSRYIWQLLEAFPKESISEQIYQMSLTKPSVGKKLQITKTSEVLEKMQRFLVNGGEEKPLSATAIRHYLDCSLRFYFRYIVRIPEREKEAGELDARDFGNIVHQSLERLYKPLVGQEVTRDMIEDLLNSQAIKEAVDKSFQTHFKGASYAVVEGKDLLQQQIIEKLLFKAVEKDFRNVPFTLTGTELKVVSDLEFGENRKVKLEGTLDRVHLANQAVHIVDYKTGKADLIRKGSYRNKIEQYIQDHFDHPKYKAGFQGFFYGYLWSKQNHKTPLRLGVYPLKKVNEGTHWLYQGDIIPSSGFIRFERLLIETIQELFDKKVAFTQTEDISLCQFCAYKEICQR